MSGEVGPIFLEDPVYSFVLFFYGIYHLRFQLTFYMSSFYFRSFPCLYCFVPYNPIPTSQGVPVKIFYGFLLCEQARECVTSGRKSTGRYLSNTVIRAAARSHGGPFGVGDPQEFF